MTLAGIVYIDSQHINLYRTILIYLRMVEALEQRCNPHKTHVVIPHQGMRVLSRVVSRHPECVLVCCEYQLSESILWIWTIITFKCIPSCLLLKRFLVAAVGDMARIVTDSLLRFEFELPMFCCNFLILCLMWFVVDCSLCSTLCEDCSGL